MLKVLTRLELWIEGVRRVFTHGDDVTDHLHPHDADALLKTNVIEDTDLAALHANLDESRGAFAARDFEDARQAALAAAESARVTPVAPVIKVVIQNDPASFVAQGLSEEQLAASRAVLDSGAGTGAADGGDTGGKPPGIAPVDPAIDAGTSSSTSPSDPAANAAKASASSKAGSRKS
jgi:hypothetical protein